MKIINPLIVLLLAPVFLYSQEKDSLYTLVVRKPVTDEMLMRPTGTDLRYRKLDTALFSVIEGKTMNRPFTLLLTPGGMLVRDKNKKRVDKRIKSFIVTERSGGTKGVPVKQETGDNLSLVIELLQSVSGNVFFIEKVIFIDKEGVEQTEQVEPLILQKK